MGLVNFDNFPNIKKHREILELDINLDQDKLVSSIIQDLLFRPFNSDVFLIRNIVENFDIDIDYHNNTEKIIDILELFTQWIKNNDYRYISQWIFNVNKTMDVVEIYNICLDILFYTFYDFCHSYWEIRSVITFKR